MTWGIPPPRGWQHEAVARRAADSLWTVLDILAATTPIFLVVAVGWALTRAGLFRREDMSVFSTFVVKLALPLLIFVNVAGRDFAEVFNLTYLLTYALAAWVMMAVGRLYARARGLPDVRGVFIAWGMSGTNNGFVGFPIFLLILPSVAGLAVGMDMLVDNTAIIPVALAMVEGAANGSTNVWVRVRQTVVRVVTHPMIIAIVAALALTALGVELPAALDRAVTLLAQTSSGVALFAVGGMLVGLRVHGMITDVLVTVAGKLLVQPLAAIGLVLGLVAIGLPELSPELRAAAILTCALPSMSVLAPIGEEYGEGELGAAVLMLSTVLSFLTITGWMVALRLAGWL